MSSIRKDRLAIVIIIIVAVVLALGYLAGERTISKNATEKIGVAVSIAPEVEFVEKIGGDRVEVTLMVPPTADVHTYEPLATQLSEVSQARMYVQVGSEVEFEENYMDKLESSNPEMLVVNASKGLELLPSTEEGESETADPHVWTSPRNAKVMVENIYQGLVEVDPEGKEYYQKNRDQYLAELDELDRNATQLLENKTRPIIILHPAFAYYARDYNLTMMGVMESDEEPSPQRIAMMVDLAREHNITVVYGEPQYDPRFMDTIASQIGGRVLLVSDLSENYLENTRNVTIAFSKS